MSSELRQCSLVYCCGLGKKIINPTSSNKLFGSTLVKESWPPETPRSTWNEKNKNKHTEIWDKSEQIKAQMFVRLHFCNSEDQLETSKAVYRCWGSGEKRSASEMFLRACGREWGSEMKIAGQKREQQKREGLESIGFPMIRTASWGGVFFGLGVIGNAAWLQVYLFIRHSSIAGMQ